MKKQTREVYTFDELDEEVQQEIIDRNRDLNLHFDWHEHVYEDYTIQARLFGLDISKIFYSGFYSQGDGASFKCEYSYEKGWFKKLKEYSPNDAEVFKIAKKLQEVQRKYFYQIYATSHVQGHYVHSGCMQVNSELIDNSNDLPCEVEEEIQQLLREYADIIYTRLEKEYEYLTSDNQVKEHLIENDYEFLKNGQAA